MMCVIFTVSMKATHVLACHHLRIWHLVIPHSHLPSLSPCHPHTAQMEFYSMNVPVSPNVEDDEEQDTQLPAPAGQTIVVLI